MNTKTSRTYLFKELVAAEVSLLFILLQASESDVLPKSHDGLLMRRLLHVDDISELGAQLEALRSFMSVQVDGDVHVFVATALESEFVKVCSGWQAGRPLGPLADIGFLPLHILFGAVAELRSINVDIDGLEEVRETRLLGRLGSTFVILAVGYILAVFHRGILLLRLILVIRGVLCIILVVEKTTFNLDAIGRLRVWSEVKGVYIEAIPLPDLVLNRVADPYTQRLACLCIAMKALGKVQALASHRRVQSPLDIPQVVVSLGRLGVHNAIFDTIGQVLVGGLSASTFSQFAGLCLGLLLLGNLRLRQRHLGMGTGGHHRNYITV